MSYSIGSRGSRDHVKKEVDEALDRVEQQQAAHKHDIDRVRRTVGTFIDRVGAAVPDGQEVVVSCYGSVSTNAGNLLGIQCTMNVHLAPIPAHQPTTEEAAAA